MGIKYYFLKEIMIKNTSLNCDTKKIQLYKIENEPNPKNEIIPSEKFHSIYAEELDIHYVEKIKENNLINENKKRVDENSFLKLYDTPYLGGTTKICLHSKNKKDNTLSESSVHLNF